MIVIGVGKAQQWCESWRERRLRNNVARNPNHYFTLEGSNDEESGIQQREEEETRQRIEERQPLITSAIGSASSQWVDVDLTSSQQSDHVATESIETIAVVHAPPQNSDDVSETTLETKTESTPLMHSEAAEILGDSNSNLTRSRFSNLNNFLLMKVRK